MELSTLTQKGQATIPKRIRDHLGLHPQEQIAFFIKDNTVILDRANASTEELAGALKEYGLKKIPSNRELYQSIKSAAVQRDQRTK